MQIALVPLDERPVNIEIPREVAEIAGAELALPPVTALPVFREPADIALLHAWVQRITTEAATSHLVVCVDTLVFGGIIPARIGQDGIAEAIARLDLLRMLRETARPDLVISAVSLVMRASDSYSAVEEPAYWASHGRELHRHGGALHHALEREVGDREASPRVDAGVPDAVLADFELRRLRNHIVNMATIAFHETGVLDTLAITADDTAPHSAGSVEQVWLRHWQRALPAAGSILNYPGADEVGAVLVARALVRDIRPPAIAIVCGETGGLDRVPNFENVAIRESSERQIDAVGGYTAAEHETPDIALVIHAPDPDRGDYFGGVPRSDPRAVQSTVAAVERWLTAGIPVALADVRFSNGADPVLVDELASRGLLLKLSSYAGWNTAGNSLGSALAHAVGRWAGTLGGTLDERAAERALLSRILEDRAYQSGARRQIQEDLMGGSIQPVEEGMVTAAVSAITAHLQSYLDQITSDPAKWRVTKMHLPWNRSFEIGFSLEYLGNG